MNMKEAADRLEAIVKKLGGGTSTSDETELRNLLREMQGSAAKAAPKTQPRKRRATAEARKPAPDPAPTAKPAPKRKTAPKKGKTK